jgi:hypothetical protein
MEWEPNGKVFHDHVIIPSLSLMGGGGVVRSPWLLRKKSFFVVVVIEVWSWKNLVLPQG